MKRTLKRKTSEPPKRKLKRRSEVTGSGVTSSTTPERSTTKRHLKRKPEPPKKPTSRPTPTIPPNFKWKGKPYPNEKGFVFVQGEDMPEEFPRFSAVIVPGTSWVVEPKTNRIVRVCTRMSDGLMVGWDYCARCLNHATRCPCPQGIMHPRSLEFIYVKSAMREKGIDVQAPTDATSPMFTEHGLFWYKRKQSTGPSVAPMAPRPAKSPAPARKTLSRAQTKPEPVPTMTDIDAAAAKSAKSLTRSLKRTLSKGEAPKRTLTRKKK